MFPFCVIKAMREKKYQTPDPKLRDRNQSLEWPIIGHKSIVKFLQKSILNNKIAHAYLFCGLKHLGKRTMAEYFASSLLTNLQESTTNNTNGLEDIGEIGERSMSVCDLKRHPDFYEIKKEEGKKNISIEQIRQIKLKLNLSSFLGGYKVALIDEAEDLTEEASNALLKTLEEPSEKTVIILITTNASTLSSTIISRCQMVRFLPVAQKELATFLGNREIASPSRPSIEILRDDNFLIALSQSRPGILINFLENPENLAEYQEKVEKFVKIAESQLGQKWQVIDQIMPKTAKLLESQEFSQSLLLIWKSVIRDLLLIKIEKEQGRLHTSGENIYLINLFLREKLMGLAEKYSLNNLKEILEEVDLTQKYLRWNVNPRLAMENFIISKFQ